MQKKKFKDMSDNNQKRSSLSKPVVLFFVFAVLCVAAFLIVILVKSCDADHEEKIIEQEEIGLVIPTTVDHLLS